MTKGKKTPKESALAAAIAAHAQITELVAAIDHFDDVCQEDDYTDTADAWELLNRIRTTLAGPREE